jgi:hypothetical protein
MPKNLFQELNTSHKWFKKKGVGLQFLNISRYGNISLTPIVRKQRMNNVLHDLSEFCREAHEL